MEQHEMECLAPARFQCAHCDKKFKQKKILEVHLASKHVSSRLQKHECDICSKKYLLLGSIGQNLIFHLFFPFLRFLSKNNLQIHVKNVHENTYLRVCEVCGKEFRSKMSFDVHMMSHAATGKPTEQCEECGQIILQHRMRFHRRSHLESKMNITCEICNLWFRTKDNLQSHKRFRHERIGFTCETCNKVFRTSKKLKARNI